MARREAAVGISQERGGRPCGRRAQLERPLRQADPSLTLSRRRHTEAAHKVDRLQVGHAEEGEVAEIDPEGVRVLRLVQLAQLLLLHLLLAHAGHVADEHHAPVGGALKALGRHAEGGLAARLGEILGVARHAREAENREPVRVRREADQRAGRVALHLRGER